MCTLRWGSPMGVRLNGMLVVRVPRAARTLLLRVANDEQGRAAHTCMFVARLESEMFGSNLSDFIFQQGLRYA